MRSRFTRQRGAVLITSLLFLIILAGVGIVLVQSSAFDLRMAGAAQMKKESSAASMGAVDVVTNMASNGNLPTSGDLANMDPTATQTLTASTLDLEGTSATVSVLTSDTGAALTTCPRSEPAYEEGVVQCTTARITSSHAFDSSEQHPDSTNEAMAYQRYINASNN